MPEGNRDILNDIIRCIPYSPQDYFWTFATMEWASKDINESNVFEEASAAADGYVEQLRKTGVLK